MEPRTMARTADRKTILELFAFAKENEAADDDASSSSNNSDAENTVRVVFAPLTYIRGQRVGTLVSTDWSCLKSHWSFITRRT